MFTFEEFNKDIKKLYHATTIINALSIVNDNLIKAAGHRSSRISFTTNKKIALEFQPVIFIFDAQKLNNKYTIFHHADDRYNEDEHRIYNHNIPLTDFLIGIYIGYLGPDRMTSNNKEWLKELKETETYKEYQLDRLL